MGLCVSSSSSSLDLPPHFLRTLQLTTYHPWKRVGIDSSHRFVIASPQNRPGPAPPPAPLPVPSSPPSAPTPWTRGSRRYLLYRPGRRSTSCRTLRARFCNASPVKFGGPSEVEARRRQTPPCLHEMTRPQDGWPRYVSLLHRTPSWPSFVRRGVFFVCCLLHHNGEYRVVSRLTGMCLWTLPRMDPGRAGRTLNYRLNPSRVVFHAGK